MWLLLPVQSLCMCARFFCETGAVKKECLFVLGAPPELECTKWSSVVQFYRSWGKLTRCSEYGSRQFFIVIWADLSIFEVWPYTCFMILSVSSYRIRRTWKLFFCISLSAFVSRVLIGCCVLEFCCIVRSSSQMNVFNIDTWCVRYCSGGVMGVKTQCLQFAYPQTDKLSFGEAISHANELEITELELLAHRPMTQSKEILFPVNIDTQSLSSCRAAFWFAPRQWEAALLCNDISQWQGASPESALSCAQMRFPTPWLPVLSMYKKKFLDIHPHCCWHLPLTPIHII